MQYRQVKIEMPEMNIEATFHGFYQQGDEPVAIVEMVDGAVTSVPIDFIKFKDPLINGYQVDK